MKKIQYLAFLILYLVSEISFSKPTKIDYFKTGSGLSIFLYSQYIYKNKSDKFQYYRQENVNSFDSFLRSKLKWNNSNLTRASIYSDVLLYGIALGSIPFTASIMDGDINENILFFINTLSVNGLITNLVKNISSRERPLYRYNSSKKKSNESFKSFYSGHTSSVFAIGTSTALLLSNQFPNSKNLIWLTTFSLSTITGYFRIASDNHYTTDVVFGAIMGIITGYFLHKKPPNRGSNLSFTKNSIRYSYHLR